MAFKKVELTKEEEEALKGGNYFKFTAVGQKMLGRFVRTQPQTGQFAKQGQLDYVFRANVAHEDGTKAVEEVVVNTNKQLNAQLAKCGLKPGYAVKITFVSELDVGQQSKMKVYEVEYDDAPPAGKAAPPPPPPPKPAAAAAEDDDVPF